MKRKYVRTGIVLALVLLLILGVRACGSDKKSKSKDQPVISEGDVLEEETSKVDESASTDTEDTPTLDSDGEEGEIREVGEDSDSSHKHSFVESVLPATCSAKGSRTYTCESCGSTYTVDIPATGHVNVTVTESNDGHHLITSYICADCGVLLNQTDYDLLHNNEKDDDQDDDSDEKPAEHEHQYTETITKAAACTENGIKTLTCGCGSSYEVSIPANGHDFKFSETKLPTCEAAGEMLLTCKVCGKETAEPIPAAGHTPSENWATTEEPSCEQEGVQVQVCAVCNAKLDEKSIPANGHDFAKSVRTEPKCETEGEMLLTCNVCGKETAEAIPALGHNYQEAERVAPSCTLEGFVREKCSRCNDEKKTVIPATGHGAAEWVITKEPTDLEEGQRKSVCTVCQATLKTELIDKLPHTHGFDTVIKETKATCTADGEIVRQCRCTETETKVIPATGHKGGEFVTTKEPTYTEVGFAEQHCVNEGCGILLETKTLPVKPHEHQYEIDNENSKPATCEEDGTDVKVCTFCKDTVVETVKATGHTEGAATITKEAGCETDGMQEFSCTLCQKVLRKEPIAAKGHTTSDWTVLTAPTCEADGVQVKNCAVCGKEMERQVISSTGHSYGDFETTKEPSCETNGEEASTCAACGSKTTRSIPATGHSYGDWIIDKEATEDAPGEQHKECASCGNIIREEIEKLPPHEHDWKETGRTEATCSSAGRIDYACECGETYSAPIQKLDHTPGDWETIEEATEDKEGLRQKTCTVCGTVTAKESIPKLPHEHSYQITATEEPTCTKEGKNIYICKCGHSYEEPIPAKGHDFEEPVVLEPTCTEDGQSERTCKVCKEVETTKLPALGHDYVESEEECYAPTCTFPGMLTKRCTRCPEFSQEELPATGHKYEIVKKEPTCESDGYIRNECKNCKDWLDDEHYEILTRLGHDYQWTVTVEPALDEFGEESDKCTRCNHVRDTRIIPGLTEDDKYRVYPVRVKKEDGTYEIVKVYGYYDNAKAEAFLKIMNEYRGAEGFTPVTKHDSMVEWTQQRGPQLAVQYAHKLPDGSKNPNWVNGENIYRLPFWFTDPERAATEAFTIWKNSPIHNENMLNKNFVYTDVTCFVSVEKNSDGTYQEVKEHWAQVFSYGYNFR